MSQSERTITFAEIMEWVGNTSEAILSPSQYENIADGLTKLHWPGEAQQLVPRANKEPDDGWDLFATTKAANQLWDSLPKIMAFQASLRCTPETREGHDAIKALQAALAAALPYIEKPFGEYTPVPGRKKIQEWHIYAVMVANIMTQELQQAGISAPGVSRNSVIARVVLKALQRMGIPQSKTLSKSAIGAYLTRWNKQFGSSSVWVL